MERRYPATADQLPIIMAAVATFWDEAELPPALMMPFELAVEELFVNVVTHATQVQGAVPSVMLSLDHSTEQVTAVFSDNGPAFDPTGLDTPDTSLDADSRRVGGLGLHLIRQMMDTVRYEYREGWNRLTLAKKHPNAS